MVTVCIGSATGTTRTNISADSGAQKIVTTSTEWWLIAILFCSSVKRNALPGIDLVSRMFLAYSQPFWNSPEHEFVLITIPERIQSIDPMVRVCMEVDFRCEEGECFET
jgi:hypothetical protein